MHTDEWIARETSEDIKTNFGFPLEQSEYSLPMIKLTFGEEYIPVPQNRTVYLLLNKMDNSLPLKTCMYGSWCYTAARELGISDEAVEKTLGRFRLPGLHEKLYQTPISLSTQNIQLNKCLDLVHDTENYHLCVHGVVIL